MIKAEVFLSPPKEFNPAFCVAACYCVWDDKILLTKRHPEKPEGNTWCLPGGKIEPEETPQKAAKREVFEEVGLDVRESDLTLLTTFFVKKPTAQLVFNVYYLLCKEKPSLTLKMDELIEATWVSLEEALNLPLISAGKEVLLACEELRLSL